MDSHLASPPPRNAEYRNPPRPQELDRQGRRIQPVDLRNRVDEVTGRIFRIKNGYAGKIIIDDELLASLEKLEPTDFLVQPGAAHWTRQSLIYRRTNDCLRPFIQDRPGKKLLYELRKEAGSIVAMEQGLEAARRFLRRKSITTTLRWYHAVLEPSRGASIPPSVAA